MPGPSEESLGMLFSDVARLFWRRLEASLRAAELDFTAAEMRLLTTVVDQPGLRQTALAERLHIEPMTLVGHLDRLVAKDLVERRTDPDDRRAKLVFPTAAGEPTLERMRVASAAVRAVPMRGSTPREIETLRRVLRRIRADLMASSEDGR